MKKRDQQDESSEEIEVEKPADPVLEAIKLK